LVVWGASVLIGALLFAAPGGAAAPTQALAPVLDTGGERVPDRYIVVTKQPQAGSPVAHQARERSVQRSQKSNARIERVLQHNLQGYIATLDSKQLASVRTDPDVDYIVPDTIGHSDGSSTAGSWALDRIDQRTSQLNNTYGWGLSGSGVTVYVVDSGVRLAHNEFEGRATAGASFLAGGNAGSDTTGHGTHVAAIVAGKTYGVAKNASIVSVQVVNSSKSYTASALVSALDWIVAHRSGPSVVNMSLSGPSNGAVNDAVSRAYNAGIVLVASAGNDNSAGRRRRTHTP
jgi:subtilisin family serine protease